MTPDDHAHILRPSGAWRGYNANSTRFVAQQMTHPETLSRRMIGAQTGSSTLGAMAGEVYEFPRRTTFREGFIAAFILGAVTIIAITVALVLIAAVRT